MLRLGIVDCDTSHVYQFARRLNHTGIAEDQWVDGARIVAAYPGTSRVESAETIAKYVGWLREAGVAIVDQPKDLLGQVDAVLVESNQGAVHRERATPFLETGLPVFVDKPFAGSTADARAMVELAARRGAPLISASSLRFVPAIAAARDDPALGTLGGADVYSPGHLNDANPGLLHYGVHGVEMLYALLGPGCQEVSCTFHERGEVVTGRWGDGRIGVVRALRAGAQGYGFTAYGEQGIRSETVPTSHIYRDLLAAVVPVLAGGPSPVSGAELIEVIAFQEAALASVQASGQPIALPV
ncbi:MAG TPA: Gfo/Idh/MocA family oxidoreductase [Thermomicrobiales bacterium]|jgi:predicted dehydrogenase|nr:Gfo/Idh/MocA family oxidoreductase [Thermomicrobiales bacterium]